MIDNPESWFESYVVIADILKTSQKSTKNVALAQINCVKEMGCHGEIGLKFDAMDI